MSEGDVSMIQDEDVLRRMWQQTDDFGRKKEIRAHMYRLREERLRNFYSSPEVDMAVTTATNRDATKVGQFSSSTRHTDSFADQCFQSLKSKEVRDSESPTRDYSYKLQDAQQDHNGKWIIERESKSNGDDHVVSQSTRSHISGVKDLDGGKASFAGVNEQQASVTTREDENSKYRKDEKSAKSAKMENFIKQNDDGSVMTSSSTSSSQNFSSKQIHSSTSNADTVDFVQDKSSIVDQDLIGKKQVLQPGNSDLLIINDNATNNLETLVRNNEMRTIEQARLTSRKVEHPNENTTVITETRTLPDGTKVTSTRTETKGKTVFSSKSSNEVKSVDQQSGHIENRNEKQSRSNVSSIDYDKNVNRKNDFEQRLTNQEVLVKNVTSNVIEDDLRSAGSLNRDVYADSLKKDINAIQTSSEHSHNIQKLSQKSSVKENNERDVSENLINIEKHHTLNEHCHDIQNRSQNSSVKENNERNVRENLINIEKHHTLNEQSKIQDLKELQPAKQNNIKQIDEVKHMAKSNDYTTTYQSDYTQKRISTDLSPTHQAWASSLRSDVNVPERKSPSRSSIETSQTSLRNSQSPDKTFPKTTRAGSPDKFDRTSPFRASSTEKDSFRNKTSSETHRSSVERHLTSSRLDQKRNLRDKQPSPDRSSKSRSPTHEKSPDRKTRYPSSDRTQPGRQASPAPSNYSTGTYTHDKFGKTTYDHKSHSKYTRSPDRSPDRIQKKPTDKTVIDKDNELKSIDRTSKKLSKNTYTRENVSSHDRATNSQINAKNLDETSHYRASSPVKPPKESFSPKDRRGSPTSNHYSTDTYTRTNERKETLRKTDTSSKNIDHSNFSTDTFTRNKSPEKVTQKPSNRQSDSTDEFTTISTEDIDTRGTRKSHSIFTPSISPTKSKSASSTQSRDSSPTTSVSEIEFISTSKNTHIVTDLDDLELKNNVKQEISNDSPKTSRSQSPSKSSIPVRPSSPGTVDSPTSDVKKPKQRPPFIRSETYEERCRKILGMPDKHTLVKDAEKTLSDILSILPQNNSKSSGSSSVSPYSTSPEREVTPKMDNGPKKILSEYPAQRKSPSPERRVRIMDTVDFITTEKIKDEENRKFTKTENVHPKEVRDETISKTSAVKLQPKDNVYQVSPRSSRSPSPEKITKSYNEKQVSQNNIDISINRKSDDIRRSVKSPSKDVVHQKTSVLSRSPSPEKKARSYNEKPTQHTSSDNSTKSTSYDNKTIRNSSLNREKGIDRVNEKSPARSALRDGIHPKSPLSSRSPSPGKVTADYKESLITQKVIDNTNKKSTKTDRSVSPSKSPTRYLSPERQTKEKDKFTTEKHTLKSIKKQEDAVSITTANKTKEITKSSRSTSPTDKYKEQKNVRSVSPPKKQPTSPNKDKSPTKIAPVQRPISPSKSPVKKTLSEYPAQRKPSSENLRVEKKKIDSSKIDVNSTKSTTHSTYRKTNKHIDSSTERVKEIVVDSSSDTEQERKVHVTRRKSIDKLKHNLTNKANNPSPSRPIHKSKVFAGDVKITRTTSDLTIKPQHINGPVRNKSKPEINVTRISSSRSTNKQTINTSITTSKLSKQSNKTEMTKPQSPTKLTTKPKSATTLNTSEDEDNIIIDIQHAKSSRENSPDKLCPMPVGANEDTGKPRFPDQVSEPDDDKRPKMPEISTIHESDSIASFSDSKIVELSDADDVQDINVNSYTAKDRLSDESYSLNVNQKVSKFLIESEKLNNKFTKDNIIPKNKTNIGFDEANNIDDSLLSVSDKVSKFLAAADKSKLDKISDRTHITNDQYKINISDKASLFSKNKDVTKPVTSVNQTPITLDTKEVKQQKSERIEKDVLNYSNKNDRSEELSTQRTVIDTKNKFEVVDGRRGSITKDTVSSQAKSFDSKSPNLKSPVTPEKPTVKITALRSSEAVKKAKALFENISSPQADSKPRDTPKRGTNLSDIGVFRTSKEVVNDEVDVTSTVTDSEIGIEIDIVPNVKQDKIQYSKGTYHRPGNHLGNYPKTQRPKSPEPDVATTAKDNLNIKDLPIDKSNSPKNVLTRYPQGQRPKSPEAKRELFSKSKITSNSIISNKSFDVAKHDTKEFVDVEETREVSSRRGSGKFGIELRRTSTDHTSAERRRSSTGEPHLQPCIEDIDDLVLLEQMLERVVGYEQRRRIRAQIRVVKKKKDVHKTQTLTTDKLNFSKPYTSIKQITSLKTDSHNILNSERSTATKETSSLDDRKKISSTTTRNYSPERLSRRTDKPVSKRTSPDKRMTNTTDLQSRQTEKIRESTSPIQSSKQSPGRRQRPVSPVKSPPSNKIKSTKYNEYTTAYMKKIGIDVDTDRQKSKRSPTKQITDKFTRNDIYDTRHRKHEIEKFTVTKSTERRSSKTEVEVIHRNGTKSPSPDGKRKTRENDRLYRRTPSPDFKRPRDESQKSTEYRSTFTSTTSKSTTDDLLNGVHNYKNDGSKPIWATTNILRKTDTSEPRIFTSKKVESDKITKRAKSPSKTITKATDLITSSYGVGPTDENGKPLFGIRALRNQNGSKQNYQVKGTVVKKEFHSRNGGEPEGEISITAYSSNPEDLTRFLENNNAANAAEEIKKSLHEKQDSRQAITSITSTKKFGSSAGNTMSKIHNERAAIAHTPEALINLDRKVVRQGSVKSLTEKFIKNAVETTKTEKEPYPKAGLILRSGRRSSGSLSSGSSTHDILAWTESNASIDSEETSTFHSRNETTNITSSFLDSNTKVTGVQDILSRMKNADIVIQEGDTSEDAEARALLNKFLGATCLMTGMESYATQKPQSRHQTQETKTRTFSKTTSSSAKDIDISSIWDEKVLRGLLDECADYERRRLIRARLRQVMAEQEACAQIVADAVSGESTTPTIPTATTVVKQSSQEEEKSTKVEGSVVTTVTSEKTTNVTSTKETKVSESSNQQVKKPVSPFAKFKQLEKQNSTPTSPSSPKTPMTPGGTQPLFRFTDPQLQASASTIKERLLQWCRDKTKEYENVKLDNFSTSWSDGLAFCALIHHFLPDAFDFAELTPEKRRHNFTLAFKVADEKAGIFPLLDVDDMVAMRKPDWKCVFTYVQAIHRRFKDQN